MAKKYTKAEKQAFSAGCRVGARNAKKAVQKRTFKKTLNSNRNNMVDVDRPVVNAYVDAIMQKQKMPESERTQLFNSALRHYNSDSTFRYALNLYYHHLV